MISFIEGEKVSLRSLHRDDLNEKYLNWLNDNRVNKFLDSGIFPSTYESLNSFYNRIVDSSNSIIFAIIINESGKHIGNVKLEPINWIHRTCYFGIMIGDTEEHGKGYAKEATKLCIEYAFNKLDLRKVSLGVVSDNTIAVSIYKKVGFNAIGIAKKDCFYNGKYYDVTLMEILKSDYIKREE